MPEEIQSQKQKPSRLWYLLAIFLGIIGGIIGYFVLKDRDRKFAERLLIIGVVMIIVAYGLSILLSFLAYIYISGVTTSTASLEFDGAYCSNGVAYLMIRNGGLKSMAASSWTCTPLNNPCSGLCTPVNLDPGLSKAIEISGCSLGVHTYRIIGPANSLTIPIECIS